MDHDFPTDVAQEIIENSARHACLKIACRERNIGRQHLPPKCDATRIRNKVLERVQRLLSKRHGRLEFNDSADKRGDRSATAARPSAPGLGIEQNKHRSLAAALQRADNAIMPGCQGIKRGRERERKKSPANNESSAPDFLRNGRPKSR